MVNMVHVMWLVRDWAMEPQDEWNSWGKDYVVYVKPPDLSVAARLGML